MQNTTLFAIEQLALNQQLPLSRRGCEALKLEIFQYICLPDVAHLMLKKFFVSLAKTGPGECKTHYQPPFDSGEIKHE